VLITGQGMREGLSDLNRSIGRIWRDVSTKKAKDRRAVILTHRHGICCRRALRWGNSTPWCSLHVVRTLWDTQSTYGLGLAVKWLVSRVSDLRIQKTRCRVEMMRITRELEGDGDGR
jgi:hypothetical protein